VFIKSRDRRQPRVMPTWRRSPRRRVVSSTDYDDLMRRETVAKLLGQRIVNGISDEEMARRMYYLTGDMPRNKRQRQKKIDDAIAKLRQVEFELADGRLSTLQRYARAVGMRMGPRFVWRRCTPRPLQNARRIRAGQDYLRRYLNRLALLHGTRR
jgi:hypothetical protein